MLGINIIKFLNEEVNLWAYWTLDFDFFFIMNLSTIILQKSINNKVCQISVFKLIHICIRASNFLHLTQHFQNNLILRTLTSVI